MTHAVNLLRFGTVWSAIVLLVTLNAAAYVVWVRYVLIEGQRINAANLDIPAIPSPSLRDWTLFAVITVVLCAIALWKAPK